MYIPYTPPAGVDQLLQNVSAVVYMVFIQLLKVTAEADPRDTLST